MHRVALQDYISRIERLLDENRLPEAASHCHFILGQFPRFVIAYRLYGRVLLEQHQYDNAIDIFQRVTSADPEDLIAHAGLSLAFKEKLDLPQAVWHMERAFEIDPYNRAVRDELAELYAVRDGYTRQRIELTGPALARIYLNGSLYDNAVTELRRLLPQHPNRNDLRLLMAEALFRLERREDANELCRSIIEVMPYCIMANAILACTALGTGGGSNGNEYLVRLQSLTLPTSKSLDPNTTIGLALSIIEDFTLPEKIIIEQLDDVSAATRIGDSEASWGSETEEPPLDEDQMPGWLEEIGFTEMVSPGEDESFEDTFIEDQDVEDVVSSGFPGIDEIEDSTLYDSELPDSAPLESSLPDNGLPDSEILTGVILATELEESQFHDETLDDDLLSLLEGDDSTEIDSFEIEEAEEDIQIPSGLPLAAALVGTANIAEDEEPDTNIEPAFEDDVLSAAPFASSAVEEWDEVLDDLDGFVDELQSRKGQTGLLSMVPDPEEASTESGSDWLEDITGGSEVGDDLPGWLYEAVGFTDDLDESPEEKLLDSGSEGLGGFDDSLDDKLGVMQPTSKTPQNALDDHHTEQAPALDQEGSDISEEFSEFPELDTPDSDLPDWLLQADDVLEELPEELAESKQDSWQADQEADGEDVSWLEELTKIDDIESDPTDSSQIRKSQASDSSVIDRQENSETNADDQDEAE